ncbi:MAG: glycosyltransferase family 39 protein [Magnetococcus sp. DMHC-6]
MLSHQHKIHSFLLLPLIQIASIFLFIWGIGNYDLWNPWEPKYPQTVAEMSERGDWITPYYEGEVRWTKPVLHYWAMAIPISLFGNNEWSARLPSGVAATFGVILLFFVCNYLFDSTTGLMSAAVLATLPQYYFMARQAMPDMMFCVFLAAALGFLAQALFDDTQKKIYFVWSYIALGLAILTKGPLAPVIYLGTILLFHFIDYPNRKVEGGILAQVKIFFSTYQLLPGGIILVAVAGYWFVSMAVQHGWDFFDNAIFFENLERFIRPILNLSGDSSFFMRTLVFGMFPWGGLLPVAALFMFGGPGHDLEMRKRWFFLAWFLTVFLILSASGSKLQHYFLPAMPPAAVLIALFWRDYFKPEPKKWMRIAFLFGILFIILPIRDFTLPATNEALFDSFMRHTQDIENIPSLSTFFGLFFCAWAAVLLAGMRWPQASWVAVSAVVLAFTNAIYTSHVVLPKQYTQPTIKAYLNYYEQHKTLNSEILVYAAAAQSTLYYVKHYQNSKRKSQFFEAKELARLHTYIDEKKSDLFLILGRSQQGILSKTMQLKKNGWLRVDDKKSRYLMYYLPPKKMWNRTS